MAPIVDVADSVVRADLQGWPCSCRHPTTHRRNSGGVQRRASGRQKRQQKEIVDCPRNTGEAMDEVWPREKYRSTDRSPTRRCCFTPWMDARENSTQAAYSAELQLPHQKEPEASASSRLVHFDGGTSRHFPHEEPHGKQRNFFLFEEQEAFPTSPTLSSLTGASTTGSFSSPSSSAILNWHLRSPAQRREGEPNKPPAFYKVDQKVESCQSSPVTRNQYLPEFCFSLKRGLLHESLLYLFVLWAAPELLREEFYPSIQQVIDRQSGFAG